MRVISGTARGTRLRPVKGMLTRPTADRIKENLFNMLAPDIGGCKFLDIFSGTGAIGIEALSRGAELAVFVDSAAAAAEVIRFNLNATGLAARAKLLRADFRTALPKLKADGFDIIFMDPPYRTSLAGDACGIIMDHGLLNADGYIVAELESGALIEHKDLVIFKTKDYASTSVVFLRRSSGYCEV